jgi:nucleotide-binding universal stress UspA family protein
LDPVVFRAKWKEATAIGLISFAAPFLGCTAIAYYLLDWTVKSSWLAGVALSTTSVAVVYAVMLELGLNKTEFGKTVLAACFITDLGTVISLGLIFAPFTIKTAVFVVVSAVAFTVLPWLTPKFFKKYGGRPSELEAKYLLLILFGLGSLAVWSESEAVLPGLREKAKERGMEIKTEIAVGHPADQIVRYAKEKSADMIVIGQKGKSKIESWLLGSVSKRVATYAPCTVTIVK